jgi:hypothetical protein
MAHIIDLLSLLVNVSGLLVGIFGLTGSFKRRVAIVILHLVGAYILAQLFSPVSLFLAKGLATFLPAQLIVTASPVLLKFFSFLYVVNSSYTFATPTLYVNKRFSLYKS